MVIAALFTAILSFAGVQDTVGIDIEGDFDLRHTARRRVDAIEVSGTDPGFVIRRTFTLTLQHMDGCADWFVLPQ